MLHQRESDKKSGRNGQRKEQIAWRTIQFSTQKPHDQTASGSSLSNLPIYIKATTSTVRKQLLLWNESHSLQIMLVCSCPSHRGFRNRHCFLHNSCCTPSGVHQTYFFGCSPCDSSQCCGFFFFLKEKHILQSNLGCPKQSSHFPSFLITPPVKYHREVFAFKASITLLTCMVVCLANLPYKSAIQTFSDQCLKSLMAITVKQGLGEMTKVPQTHSIWCQTMTFTQRMNGF